MIRYAIALTGAVALSLLLGVPAAAAPGDVLPPTGLELTPLIIIAGVLVLAGIALGVISVVRRRRRS